MDISSENITPKDTNEELKKLADIFYLGSIQLYEAREFIEFNSLHKLFIYLRENPTENFGDKEIKIIEDALEIIFKRKFSIKQLFETQS